MFHMVRVLGQHFELDLLAPIHIGRIEYAVSRTGLWAPASEAEAASVSWNGPDRAIAMVVATKDPRD